MPGGTDAVNPAALGPCRRAVRDLLGRDPNPFLYWLLGGSNGLHAAWWEAGWAMGWTTDELTRGVIDNFGDWPQFTATALEVRAEAKAVRVYLGYLPRL